MCTWECNIKIDDKQTELDSVYHIKMENYDRYIFHETRKTLAYNYHIKM